MECYSYSTIVKLIPKILENKITKKRKNYKRIEPVISLKFFFS